jgi:hypothetical protein
MVEKTIERTFSGGSENTLPCPLLGNDTTDIITSFFKKVYIMTSAFRARDVSTNIIFFQA